MLLSTVFQSYHCNSSNYSCLSWVSPILAWGSEVSCPRTLPRKIQRIQCGSNPEPLNYKSNTLPLSYKISRFHHMDVVLQAYDLVYIFFFYNIRYLFSLSDKQQNKCNFFILYPYFLTYSKSYF